MVVQQLEAPYSLTQIVPMQEVISKDSYELWKCPAEFISNYPGVKITGKSYHYFVYKNGKFHMTVNEINKESVYMFFTDQI